MTTPPIYLARDIVPSRGRGEVLELARAWGRASRIDAEVPEDPADLRVMVADLLIESGPVGVALDRALREQPSRAPELIGRTRSWWVLVRAAQCPAGMLYGVLVPHLPNSDEGHWRRVRVHLIDAHTATGGAPLRRPEGSA